MTQTHVSQRLFTLDEANAALPLVRVIARDIVQLARSILHTQERLDMIRSGDDHDPMYHDEIVDIENQLDDDCQRLQIYVQELADLGVEPKGLEEGLVDFPALRNGEIVYLCWQYNEPEIQNWHSLTGGYVGRQPIRTFFDNTIVTPR